MTTNTPTTSFWARVWNWVLLFDDGLNYDSTQYNFEQMKRLQRQIDALTQRIEQLEKDSNTSQTTNMSLSSSKSVSTSR